MADELYYGGAAGSGKSQLLLGLGATQARNSIIFRRQFPRLKALIEQSRKIYSQIPGASYNGQNHTWRLDNNRTAEFGAIQHEHDRDKYQGQPHDLIGWDELPEFPESVYRFVNIWNRPQDMDGVNIIRCRVVATGNPPNRPSGEWVKEYWAPWLRKGHENPARDGELVWYVRDNDLNIDVEVGRGDVRPDPIEMNNGELIYPRSRTFISGKVEDNPYAMAQGYNIQLDQLPEPLRSQMRHGRFDTGVIDDVWQVIPSVWVDLAMARWTKDPPCPQSAIGVDPARGGADNTTIAIRHGDWFRLKVYPGHETPTGQAVAGLVFQEIQVPHVPVQIDIIGVGSSPYDMCRDLGMRAIPIDGREGAYLDRQKKRPATDRSGLMRFRNKRSWHWWLLREALNPDYGSTLMLPPDERLKAELIAATWHPVGNAIAVDEKEDIKKLLGRSPDRAEAIVYAHAPECLMKSGIDLL